MSEPDPPRPTLDVALLPELAPDGLGAAVMIDVLRASTTIVAAAGSGCRAVYPVETVQAARERAGELGTALLCGERGGVAPDGFDLGNSPLDFTPERVHGRSLVLTTTNGTRALGMLAGADPILIGAITNRRAVAEALRERGGRATLVCAGTEGRVSLEDIIAAGLILEHLVGTGAETTDAADLARHAAHDAVRAHGSIEGALRATAHGARLIGLGYGADVAHAARADISSVVPRFDPESGTIRVV